MDKPPTALFVANFSTNTGYAWDYIERLYVGIGGRLQAHGVRSVIAYPFFCGQPNYLEGSVVKAVLLDATLNTYESVLQTRRFIKEENIKVVYLTDHPPYSPKYLVLREAGARHIVVHDHTSGVRTHPNFLKRVLKYCFARIPGCLADDIVTVSEYVARRQVEIAQVPKSQVTCIWNGLPTPPLSIGSKDRLLKVLSVTKSRYVIGCACRATKEKGVEYLLLAFDELAKRAAEFSPLLIYVGDGPYFATLEALRVSLKTSSDIHFLGYRKDALAILEGVDLCVVPSVWQDAFPLAVLETMALGKPVIGTRVGGIPEMIEHDISGILVDPSNASMLAGAMYDLATDPRRADRLGNAARERVARVFSPENQLDSLAKIVMKGF